jgi:hypothetical protein
VGSGRDKSALINRSLSSLTAGVGGNNTLQQKQLLQQQWSSSGVVFVKAAVDAFGKRAKDS